MIILIERKQVEHDKLNSIHSNTIILNLRCCMVYGRYRLQSTNVNIRMWRKKNV